MTLGKLGFHSSLCARTDAVFTVHSSHTQPDLSHCLQSVPFLSLFCCLIVQFICLASCSFLTCFIRILIPCTVSCPSSSPWFSSKLSFFPTLTSCQPSCPSVPLAYSPNLPCSISVFSSSHVTFFFHFSD